MSQSIGELRAMCGMGPLRLLQQSRSPTVQEIIEGASVGGKVSESGAAAAAAAAAAGVSGAMPCHAEENQQKPRRRSSVGAVDAPWTVGHGREGG